MRSKGPRVTNEDVYVFKRVEKQLFPGQPVEVVLEVDYDEKSGSIFK